MHISKSGIADRQGSRIVGPQRNYLSIRSIADAYLRAPQRCATLNHDFLICEHHPVRAAAFCRQLRSLHAKDYFFVGSTIPAASHRSLCRPMAFPLPSLAGKVTFSSKVRITTICTKWRHLAGPGCQTSNTKCCQTNVIFKEWKMCCLTKENLTGPVEWKRRKKVSNNEIHDGNVDMRRIPKGARCR